MSKGKYVAYVSSYTQGDSHGIRIYDVDMKNGRFKEKDKVEITDKNELKINGSIVNEPDIFYKTPAYVDGISYPVKVKKDQYFILCDFREGAKDSRYFGAVNAKDIKGRVITVLRRSNL